MPDKKNRQLGRYEPGFFRNIADQIKLIGRLMLDRRVHPLLKLLPLASGLYFLFPDIAPGPIDDALIIGIGTVLFVELCPPDIVAEHRDALARTIPGKWRDAEQEKAPEQDQIIEGEFRQE